MPPVAQKQILRNEMRLIRSALAQPRRESAAEATALKLMALPAFNQAEIPVTAVYLNKAEELSLDPFIVAIAARFARIAAPVYIRDEEPHFAEVHSLEDLPPGALGLRTPPPGSPKIPGESIDIILLPGLAFDRRGGRLGYGGGWYDKVVENLRDDALKIGVCFDCQIVEDVPMETHDARVDIIVTESQTIYALHPNR